MNTAVFNNAQLKRLFVKKVSAFPWVSRIAVEPTPIPRIWTVIVAEPFDSAKREPVCEAQLAAIEAYPDVSVDFRLVNLNEYPGYALEEIVPADAKYLYERLPGESSHHAKCEAAS